MPRTNMDLCWDLSVVDKTSLETTSISHGSIGSHGSSSHCQPGPDLRNDIWKRLEFIDGYASTFEYDFLNI